MKVLQGDLCKIEEEKDFDVFGKHVARQLQRLSDEEAIIAQGEIQNVLTKCLLDNLRSKKQTFTWSSAAQRAYRTASSPTSVPSPSPSVPSPSLTVSPLPSPSVPCTYTLLPQSSPISVITQDSEDSITFIDMNYEKN